jgi:type I restriction enzyme, R subunit
LLASIRAILADLDRLWEKEQPKGEVQTFILDKIYPNLLTPPYTEEEKELAAAKVYVRVWRRLARSEWPRVKTDAGEGQRRQFVGIFVGMEFFSPF